MQILIKTLTGRQQAFNFDATSKVLEVKHAGTWAANDRARALTRTGGAVQEKEGIQVDQIRLIFGGKQMSDDKSLEEYSVTPGSVIHMVLQLRGGASG